MKKITLILVYAVFSIILIGCSNSDQKTLNENQSKKIKAPQENVQPQKEKGQESARNLNFEDLQKVKAKTFYSIDGINNKSTKGSLTNPLEITEDVLIFSGWAMDDHAQKVAGGAFLEIGDKFYPVTYGNTRPDIAKVYNNKNLFKSGFKAQISKNNIPKGIHEIKLHVVDNSKKNIFSPRSAKNIKIKI